MSPTRQLRLLVLPDAAAVSRAVADTVIAVLSRKPDAVLGLATGETMRPVYHHLVQAHAAGLSFARATSFNLDEYIGLPPKDPRSFAAYMDAMLFDHVDWPAARRRFPDVQAVDRDAAGARYEADIAAAGGLDLLLLGLGANGHIAFNEPGSPFGSRTRRVTLAPETRAANAAAFPSGDMPKEAVSMGIATILAARSLVVAASGPRKAEALAGALDGAIGEDCPASVLRTHGDVTVICDLAAADRLSGARRERLARPSSG